MQISFEAKEISARSSSFGNKPTVNSIDVVNLRSPSPVRGLSTEFTSKYQSIYDRIRKSDMSVAAICDRSSKLGMHTEPFKPSPLSDIHTINISSDSNRSSWQPEIQDSFMEKLQNELFTPAELVCLKLFVSPLQLCFFNVKYLHRICFVLKSDELVYLNVIYFFRRVAN